MQRREFLKNTGVIGLATMVTPIGIFQTRAQKSPIDSLLDNFNTPPSSAKPHTWWHWMNGNVTKEGITLDLEAMARVGIGGFQNFDAGTGIPKGPVIYLSPEWVELKKHAIKEAERLGLEFTMHNCPGWSSSGGPWITPELAMQEVTWSEVIIAGGKKKDIVLPQPFTRLDTYKDVAVIAFKSLPGELLLDKRTVTVKNLDNSGIEYDFVKPVGLQHLSFITAADEVSVQASDDGVSFKEIAQFRIQGDGKNETLFSRDISPFTTKFLRLISKNKKPIHQIQLSGLKRPEGWDRKANFAFNRYGTKDTDPSIPSINKSDVIDITKFMQADGTLSWKAPAGQWTILRFGFTPIGTINRSAPDTGVGLECDKFSASAFEFHFNKMMESLLPFLEPLGRKGKTGMLIDSYEVGMQNWTRGFEATFREKLGYDIHHYLPAMTGRVVDSAEATDRFLWDLRRLQGDMMADNYYGKFAELCRKNNMLSYIQPYDRGPMEEMQIGSRIDINVAEFWNNLSSIFQNNLTMRRTVKLSASIAHTNGQHVVAAESFTAEPESGKWQEHPFGLKMLGDRMFTQGLNRMVFHRFAHQPHPTAKPGMTMGPWGSHFDRTNTWWEQGKVWMEYLSRCQYLLQYGKSVADFAYFSGESAGEYTRVERHELIPSPPLGFDYDVINAETLLKRAKVVDKKLILADGVSYRVLILQDYKTMSLSLLNKIKQFAEEGLPMVGVKPLRTPGISNNDPDFKQLTDDLWGSAKIATVDKFDALLDDLQLQPDFEVSSASGDAPINWIHRRSENEEIYFLASERRSTEEIVASLRVTGKQPELWDPVTGKTIQTKIFTSKNGRTFVPVTLNPSGSVFVVFRNGIAASSATSIARNNVELIRTMPFETRQLSFPDVRDNFTCLLWAKPETSVMLDTRNFMDGQLPWTDFYAVYPVPGEKHYGKGHSTLGLTIGRNGVAVWENSSGRPEFLFSAARNISGWTNIVLVVAEGMPAIYIDGKLEKQGQKSSFIVHPSGEHLYLNEGASFFNGDLGKMVMYSEVISAEMIHAGLSAENVLDDFRECVLNRGDHLVAFLNGDYGISNSQGRLNSLHIGTSREISLTADWTITFPRNHGAPEEIKISSLESLHLHEDNGVKFFSGTCTYRKIFKGASKKGKVPLRYYLDLGAVEVIAEVVLNKKNLGIFWTRPFLIDVTNELQEGDNTLEIHVTNLWPNRLIGDQYVSEPYNYSPGGGGGGFGSLSGGAIQELPEWYKKGEPKPDDGRVAFATWRHYTKESPLLQSGLIGPVLLKIGTEIKLPE